MRCSSPGGCRLRAELPLALLLLALLGGCGTPRATPAESPAPPPSGGHFLDLDRCFTLFTKYQAHPQVDLPRNYTMKETLPAGTEWHSCASAVLDNTTVLHDVRLVLTNLFLRQADPAAPWENASENAYTLEIYASSPTLVRWLRDRGFPAEEGEIALPASPSWQATLAAPSASYTFAAPPDPQGRGALTETHARRHHAGAGGVAWADVTQLLNYSQVAGSQAVGVLAGQVKGGAADRVSLTPGVVSGLADYATSRFLYRFDKETPK